MIYYSNTIKDHVIISLQSPVLASSSNSDLLIRFIIIPSNTDAVSSPGQRLEKDGRVN